MVSYALIDSGGSELWTAPVRYGNPVWFQLCTREHSSAGWKL